MLVLLGASVALGLWLGWRWLQRGRHRPMAAAAHLLLGGAGLEAFAMLRRGAPDGTVLAAGQVGHAAGLVLVLAFLSGLLVSLLARTLVRGKMALLLTGHALLGLAGFGLFVGWVLGV